MNRENAWKSYKPKQIKEMDKLITDYKVFLDNGKTERECVVETVNRAKKAGYKDLSDIIKGGKKVKTGDKVYMTYMDKSVVLFNIGKKSMMDGMNILGAHIDSPRIDVKQNPLYEDSDFAYLDTHYYGGVKKYQWVAQPLAIHGVVVKKDGTVVNVVVGEDAKDPVFCITDLLIHLSREQLEKSGAKVIEGEQLDLMIGSKPLNGAEKDAVKANVLAILKDKYDIEEEDFLSAELEIVPAGKARDMGFDASMVMAYGQDDRVCAYTSLAAILDTDEVDYTACCILVDKEEIGSVGATGMRSEFFKNAVCELLDRMGEYSELNLRRCLANSRMLSSDVSAAFDPMFPSVFEKKNSAFMGKGMVFNKFTGSGGKSGSNDANPEFIAKIRNIMDKNKIAFQTAELGRVDAGGGGTIAYIMALYGMQVIDCGVAVLNMHAPYEVTSKADIYETKKGYEVFLKSMK